MEDGSLESTRVMGVSFRRRTVDPVDRTRPKRRQGPKTDDGVDGGRAVGLPTRGRCLFFSLPPPPRTSV